MKHPSKKYEKPFLFLDTKALKTGGEVKKEPGVYFVV